jgi:hypothetical protein
MKTEILVNRWWLTSIRFTMSKQFFQLFLPLNRQPLLPLLQLLLEKLRYIDLPPQRAYRFPAFDTLRHSSDLNFIFFIICINRLCILNNPLHQDVRLGLKVKLRYMYLNKTTLLIGPMLDLECLLYSDVGGVSSVDI